MPWRSKSGEGQAADTPMFPERAHALLATWQGAPSPRSLVADAPLYPEEHAPNLATRGFLTRIPGTLTLVSQGSTQALTGETWQWLDAPTRSQRIALCPSGMAPRGLGGWSPASRARAEARVKTACPRAAEAVKHPRFPVQAPRFETPSQAPQAWAALAHPWRSHQGQSSALIDHKRSAKKGWPMADTPRKALEWPWQAPGRPDAARSEEAKPQTAGCVRGTHLEAEHRSEAEGITGDKGQAQAEGGCRLRKAPLFFVSSLCVPKPCRMQGLVLVMPRARFVSSVAQRRLRRE